MIYNKKKIITIGSLVKTHGVHGALILRLIKGYKASILNKSKWCFLIIRDKPVPFKLVEAAESSDAEIIIQMEGISTKPDAEQLLNIEVAVESNTPLRKQKTDNILLLLSYKIFNAGNFVGIIQNIEDQGGQFLFVLENELLLPAHEDLIDRIDDKNKSIFMNLPEGLV